MMTMIFLWAQDGSGELVDSTSMKAGEDIQGRAELWAGTRRGRLEFVPIWEDDEPDAPTATELYAEWLEDSGWADSQRQGEEAMSDMDIEVLNASLAFERLGLVGGPEAEAELTQDEDEPPF